MRQKHRSQFAFAQGLREDKEEKERTKSLQKSLYLMKSSPTYDFPEKDLPTQTAMGDMYTILELEFTIKNLPLVPFEQLIDTRTTLPLRHDFTHDQIKTIGRCLFTRLHQVAQGNNVIKSRLRPFEMDCDGYGALWHLLTLTVDYLGDVCKCWGPAWTSDIDFFAYVTPLQEAVTTANLSEKHAGRNGTCYDPLEVALEYALQAQTRPSYYVAALKLQTDVENIRLCHKTVTSMPPQFILTTMVRYLSEKASPALGPRVNPNINKFQDPRQAKKPFSYAKKVQCDACK